MIIRCLYDKLVPISELNLDPKNRNKHPKDQIKRLAEILKYQGWRYPVKVSNQTGLVRSGHGRIEAAIENGWKEVPVNFQDYDNLEQEYADSVADNAIAIWAELDLAGINMDLADLGPDLNIDLLGIKDFVVEPLDKPQTEEEFYTGKIKIPLYEPKGVKPRIESLYNKKKHDELISEIERADVSEELKGFLRLAAQRHIVFSYEDIAEFYCHSSKEEQLLMENSALVIIDLEKAIENGFVQVTKELIEAFHE
jgi:hypothetical protein